MLSFSVEIGLASLEGSGALEHLQMGQSSRTNAYFYGGSEASAAPGLVGSSLPTHSA